MMRSKTNNNIRNDFWLIYISGVLRDSPVVGGFDGGVGFGSSASGRRISRMSPSMFA